MVNITRNTSNIELELNKTINISTNISSEKTVQHAGINTPGRHQEEACRICLGSRSLTGPPTVVKHPSRQGGREDEESDQCAVQNLRLHMGAAHASSMPGIHSSDMTVSDIQSHHMAPPPTVTLGVTNLGWNHT